MNSLSAVIYKHHSLFCGIINLAPNNSPNNKPRPNTLSSPSPTGAKNGQTVFSRKGDHEVSEGKWDLNSLSPLYASKHSVGLLWPVLHKPEKWSREAAGEGDRIQQAPSQLDPPLPQLPSSNMSSFLPCFNPHCLYTLPHPFHFSLLPALAGCGVLAMKIGKLGSLAMCYGVHCWSVFYNSAGCYTAVGRSGKRHWHW